MLYCTVHPEPLGKGSNGHLALCKQTRGFSCLPACLTARVMPIIFIPTQLACGGVMCCISWRLVRPSREGKLREVFTSSGKPPIFGPLARGYSPLAETSCLTERRNLVPCRWATARAHHQVYRGTPGATTPTVALGAGPGPHKPISEGDTTPTSLVENLDFMCFLGCVCAVGTRMGTL
jgi:hypothetical protein